MLIVTSRSNYLFLFLRLSLDIFPSPSILFSSCIKLRFILIFPLDFYIDGDSGEEEGEEISTNTKNKSRNLPPISQVSRIDVPLRVFSVSTSIPLGYIYIYIFISCRYRYINIIISIGGSPIVSDRILIIIMIIRIQ